jgi:type I restriction enzyme M protein
MEGDLPVRLRNGVGIQMSDCVDFPTANILSGNTLAAPKFKDGKSLRTCDYVVANLPFCDKTSSTDLAPANDPFR